MFLMKWFKRRAEAVEAAPAHFPPLSTVDTVAAADALEPIADIAATSDPRSRVLSGRVALDPVYVAMEYVGADGVLTRRPITMIAIDTERGNPALVAKCHLRQSLRTFRIDRIQCFIDDNGEILPALPFLATVAGGDIILPEARTKAPHDPESVARAIRDKFRARLSLLILAAKADTTFHAHELDAILRFLEYELVHLDRMGALGLPLSLDLVEGFRPVIAKMRPRPDSIEDYIDDVAALDAVSQGRFWQAIQQVLDADGLLHEDEVAFWSDIQQLRRDG